MKQLLLSCALFCSFNIHYVRGKNASEIARFNTPSPGLWPQSNVTGCGNTGLPPTNMLSECDEPLNPNAPDIRGYWRKKVEHEDGEIQEYIDQCGSRWIDISKPVIHDFPQCTGELGDSLGCEDYSAPHITNNDGLCSPIVAACKFEMDKEGNKCINLYTNNPITQMVMKAVSRCLQPDGNMIWTHLVFGTTIYEKVLKKDEPNCVKCVGGDHDGIAANDSETELPCSYDERVWTKCNEEDLLESPSSSGTIHQASIILCALAILAAISL